MQPGIGDVGNTDVSLVAADVAAITSEGDNHAYDIAEETPQADLPQTGDVAEWLNTYRPNSMCYANCPYTASSSYFSDLFNYVKPDVLMYDCYPFESGGATDVNTFFGALTTFRQEALQQHVPYWSYMQCFTCAAAGYPRMPSESEMRMQAFSSLTAGYTGLGYCIYDTNSAAGYYGLVGTSPTARSSYVQSMNPEITNLGQSLRFLTSGDLRFVPGSDATPTGLTNWAGGAGGDSHITNVQVNAGQAGTYKDGLIGFFTDDAGQASLPCSPTCITRRTYCHPRLL